MHERHERPEFDVADLTAMMAAVARLRAEVDGLQERYGSRDAARHAHVCALLSASLEESLDHLAQLCCPIHEGLPAGAQLGAAGAARGAYASGGEHVALAAPPAAVPEVFRSRRYLRPLAAACGDSPPPARPPGPRDLLLPPHEPVRGRGHADVPAPRAHTALLASAEWHLDRDEIRWSDEMYEIFDRDPILGPLRLDDLPPHVLPGDLPTVERMVDEAMNQVQAFEGEFRILRADGLTRSLHVVGEPVLDGSGAMRSVWVIVRDVTELRWTQAALSEAREQLLVQRQLARAEHRVAADLQRVVMPRWTRAVPLPGLDVAIHYFACDDRVGGDWYDAMSMPDDTVLVTLGDMSGHGLAAASGMTTLRSALEGFGVTGAAPGEMLYWLNRLLLQALPAEAIATALCGRYDPAERVLTWARAGHPTPLLFRGGHGSVLETPSGVVLGVQEEPYFAEQRVELRPGDVLVLFTDGLVERRGRDIDDAIEVLLGLAPRLFGADARTVVDVVVSRLGNGDFEDDACVMALRVT